MKTVIKVIGAAALLAFSAAPTQAQNLLVNPGFESTAGWNLFNGAAYSSAFARTGFSSLLDSAVNNVPGSFEAFAASPGMQFELTGYGLTPTTLLGSPAFGLIQLDFFSGPNASGTDLGTVQTSPGNALTSAQINGSSAPNVWTFLDTGIATAPAGAQSVAAYTIYVDFSGNLQGVYFDDLSLTAVPEPSVMALLGLGLAPICAWRRRK